MHVPTLRVRVHTCVYVCAREKEVQREREREKNRKCESEKGRARERESERESKRKRVHVQHMHGSEHSKMEGRINVSLLHKTPQTLSITTHSCQVQYVERFCMSSPPAVRGEILEAQSGSKRTRLKKHITLADGLIGAHLTPARGLPPTDNHFLFRHWRT